MYFRSITLFLGAILLAAFGCGTRGEQQLRPQSQDGLFHTVYAAAEAEAQAQDKLILLELWRPG